METKTKQGNKIKYTKCEVVDGNDKVCGERAIHKIKINDDTDSVYFGCCSDCAKSYSKKDLNWLIYEERQ